MVIAALLALLLVGRAVARAPWGRLREPLRLHAWLGTIVVLGLLWTMNAGVRDGLNLHLVGATVATLMFGPWLALLAMAAVLVATALNGELDWSALGINLLVTAAVPIGFTAALHRWCERCLPANYFVYIFVQAFAGSGAGVMLVGLVATGLLMAGGAFPAAVLLDEYLPFFLLLAFSEAWLGGMATTLMVVFRPEWVTTFDDRRYLTRRAGRSAVAERHRQDTGEKQE
ncbi:MAG: energy-coupling factor ABC transporter permease [Rhodocyclaceae bacterium]|nr:energy-coupling factor ABC transporter permease [Rhodocyclaceae bacterium]